MKTVLELLQEETEQALSAAFPEGLPPGEGKAEVTLCHEEGLGHYQCNNALRLSKGLKMNPRAVATKLVASLEGRLKEVCSKIEVAGPGFINFTLAPSFLSKELSRMLSDPLLGAVPPKRKERVVVEFSSPNIAKDLHVGHIRSTIIGDCLARCFEFLGYDVVRLNHIGDFGTQFGMLIAYLQEEAPQALEGEATLSELMGWYKASKVRFDADTDFKRKAQLQVVALQSGERSAVSAWEKICDISRQGFQEIYDLLAIEIVERGESFYQPYLKEVVEEFEKKGLVTLSEGAKCVFLEGFVNRDGEPLPLMIQKSDGGYNYDTTDLAALKHRIFVEKADRIIVVVDAGQSLHFQMVFAAAEKVGWLDRKKTGVEHVAFGLVLGADGKKFKTRSGTTEKLIDLLTEAVDRAKAMVQERLPEATPEEAERLAHTLGIGAIKYADLSSQRTKDYTFSYDRMLRFEGNTAVFLLYAYVRVKGLQRKVGRDIDELLKKEHLSLSHPSEISLALHLRRFAEAIENLERELMPHRLTDYLYALAEKFNAFFRDCRVEGVPEEGSRSLLVELTGRVLQRGLSILGLETVERM